MLAPRVRTGGLVHAAALVGLGLAAASGCGDSGAQPLPRPAPGEAWLSAEQLAASQIATAEVGAYPVGNEITTSGRIVFDDTRVAHVFSPVSGRVVSIEAQLGSEVIAGEALARIASAEVGNVYADVGKARADLAAAGRELRRQRALHDAQAGAARDLEAAEAAWAKGRTELRRAEARVRLFGTGSYDGVTQTFVLRSPISGQVIARAISPGMELQGQASGGAAVELFTIGSIDRVWLVGDLFEGDLTKVRTGASVAASVASYPGERFLGSIDWIAPALDPASRAVKVRCTLENDEQKLRPEMYATISIRGPATPVLAVPRSAVVRASDHGVVFVQTGRTEDGLLKFARRTVEVDEAVGGDLLPVRSGLEAGETVVVSGAIQLSGIL